MLQRAKRFSFAALETCALGRNVHSEAIYFRFIVILRMRFKFLLHVRGALIPVPGAIAAQSSRCDERHAGGGSRRVLAELAQALEPGHIVRDGGRRLCADGSTIIGRRFHPCCRDCPTTLRAANSPIQPRAACAATGARLRIQESRARNRGSESMGPPEARLRAAMLP